MAKILVTGASGNVGKYVVAYLQKMGESVVCAGTTPRKTAELFGDTVEYVKLDFSLPSTYDYAFNDIDRVFLLRPPHLSRAEDLYPFLNAAKNNHVQLVVFLSLIAAEECPFAPHYKIEKYLESSGLCYAHLRPGFFMQNFSGIHGEEIRRDNTIFVPAGKSKCSFIDTKDVGLAAATVLHKAALYHNTSHTLTGGQALDYYQVAQIITKVVGRQIVYSSPGFLRYRRRYIKRRGLNRNLVNVTAALYWMSRMGKAAAVTNDFTAITGRKPRTFLKFVQDNRASFE